MKAVCRLHFCGHWSILLTFASWCTSDYCHTWIYIPWLCVSIHIPLVFTRCRWVHCSAPWILNDQWWNVWHTYAKRSLHSCMQFYKTAQDLRMLFICFVDIPKCQFLLKFSISLVYPYLLTLIFLLEILYFLHQGNVTTCSQEIHQDWQVIRLDDTCFYSFHQQIKGSGYLL